METFHKGTLEITAEGLKITDENEEWLVTHNEITGISVEIANLLQFRIDGVAHRIVTPVKVHYCGTFDGLATKTSNSVIIEPVLKPRTLVFS